MSIILDFYARKGYDPKGRAFHEYLQADDVFWENCHDHIQVAFPLPEPSAKQPHAPVATQDDFNAIATTPELKMRVLMMLGRYLQFLDRTFQWRRAKDHNHLRITRVIRCLGFCGLNDEAFEFCEYVKSVVGKTVGKQTIWYWEEALKRNPAWLPPDKSDKSESDDDDDDRDLADSIPGFDETED